MIPISIFNVTGFVLVHLLEISFKRFERIFFNSRFLFGVLWFFIRLQQSKLSISGQRRFHSPHLVVRNNASKTLLFKRLCLPPFLSCYFKDSTSDRGPWGWNLLCLLMVLLPSVRWRMSFWACFHGYKRTNLSCPQSFSLQTAMLEWGSGGRGWTGSSRKAETPARVFIRDASFTDILKFIFNFFTYNGEIKGTRKTFVCSKFVHCIKVILMEERYFLYDLTIVI